MPSSPPSSLSPATRALIWGPKFWFVLHSLAWNYPVSPTEVTKRKYYDTVQNLPLFLPDTEMGDRFGEMLELYPLSPYLCSRASFIRWTWFIHNKVNMRIGKPTISLDEAIEDYERAINTNPLATPPSSSWLGIHITTTVLCALCIIVFAIIAALIL